METNQIRKGDAILDNTGKWHGVVSVNDRIIFVSDLSQTIHASNVIAHLRRYWSETLKTYVTIPEE